MSLQQWLVKTGGRLVQHARYYRLLLAEVSPRTTAASREVLAAWGCGKEQQD